MTSYIIYVLFHLYNDDKIKEVEMGEAEERGDT
jgi:hypothetical protein